MSGAEKLYTPELLALAVSLADFPWDESLPHQGEARSKSCGSTLAMGLQLDDDGRIEGIALRVRACAVGQASAALFARSALGKDAAAIRATHDALVLWLSDEGGMPDWPNIGLIEPARHFPARHGAILLPWQAALSALSYTPSQL